MTTDNPLLSISELPNFEAISQSHVNEAVDIVLANGRAVAEQVANDDSPPGWDNTCLPLEEAEEKISSVWNQVEHLHSVLSTPEWRMAHQENLTKIAAYASEMGQHEGVYQRLLSLSQTSVALSPTRQKIITDAIRDFKLSGVSLVGEQRKHFRQNSERLSALSAKFEENLLDATNDFSLAVDDETILGDMPADQKAAMRVNGNFQLTLQPPTYAAFMRYSPARDLREQLYRAYNTRASEFGKHDNTPILKEILKLRQEQAQLLGYNHYAEVALSRKMASSPAAALDFLSDLALKARPHAEKEISKLRSFAAAEFNIKDLQAWDVPFVSEHLRRNLYDFSEVELRPYLNENRVLAGVFDCAKQLFGISIEEDQAPLWDDHARFVRVKNADGKIIGGLYLDMYARQTKRGGAWMGETLGRFISPNISRLPVAYIVCNFTKPAAGMTAAMNWNEAETLFHEFGHALHHLLTEVEDYSASGISGVEWDAVELPSQFMENFIWNYDLLKTMTAHVDSGEPLPRALFDKALAAKRFQSGLWLMRQLEFSLFDLLLHSGKPFSDALSEARAQTQILPPPDDNRFHCGFSHIFAGGYAAGYYSYLWAEVLAADAFAAFEESGEHINPTLGEKFRREILAVGGGRPAMESFVAFRGREPEITPLLTHYGLTA